MVPVTYQEINSMKQIKIKIAPDGTPSVEAVGFTGGTACKAATKPIEDALGDVQSTVLKPEAYVQNQNTNVQQNGW